VHPANVPRQLTFSICRLKFWKLTVLSLLTVRWLWREKTRSRSRRRQGKGGTFLGRRHLKSLVELGDKGLAQKAVSLLDGADTANLEFVRRVGGKSRVIGGASPPPTR
jgi:hypothetical protein